MKKFYYISYIKRTKFGESTVGQCIPVHPLAWMVMAHQMGNSDTIVSWQEISEEEYNIYAGKL